MCMHVRMQIKLCAKCKKEIQLRADIIPKKENMDFFFFNIDRFLLVFWFFFIFLLSFFLLLLLLLLFFFFVLFHTFPLSLSSPFSTFWSLYTLSSAASVFIYT